jgi:hypothetical protein
MANGIVSTGSATFAVNGQSVNGYEILMPDFSGRIDPGQPSGPHQIT